MGEVQHVFVFSFLVLHDRERIWEYYFYNWPSTEEKAAVQIPAFDEVTGREAMKTINRAE